MAPSLIPAGNLFPKFPNLVAQTTLIKYLPAMPARVRRWTTDEEGRAGNKRKETIIERRTRENEEKKVKLKRRKIYGEEIEKSEKAREVNVNT